MGKLVDPLHDLAGTDISSQDREQAQESLSNWGPSTSAYYDADKIETEQDALDEEVEALRLQRKRLKALQEVDFGLAEATWADKGDEEDEEDEGDQGGVVTEVLPRLQIMPGMSAQKKADVMRKRYPEFEPLAREMLELRPLWEQFSSTRRNKALKSSNALRRVRIIRFRALSAYLGSLAMYFVLLTSPAHKVDGGVAEKALPLLPSELRNHPIMVDLVRCREIWSKVKDVVVPPQGEEVSANGDVAHDNAGEASNDLCHQIKATKSLSNGKQNGLAKTFIASKMARLPDANSPKALTASQARRAARTQRTEASLADLSNQVNLARDHLSVKSKAGLSSTQSDTRAESPELGDEPALAPHEAAEKSRRKNSLRFYTSQISLKDAKRTNVRKGRGMQGDEDLPHRERYRDKVERLTREAAKRGRRTAGDLRALNDVDDEEGIAAKPNKQLRNEIEEDEDDALLDRRIESKKRAKRAREATYAKARESGGRVVRRGDSEQKVDALGRREIGFAIEKNKGLTPARNKNVKNPRVKKRKRFEDKSKKLKSMKPTWKGGEGPGGYGGELTGIKKGLVKSVKF